MRGEDLHQDHLYSYVSPEQRVPANHRVGAGRTGKVRSCEFPPSRAR